ncbi:flagellar biosynthesis protein [Frigidibacter sp. SD6-1]|uniref:FliH/SctL family protein n=1 Tax=Frigidibacter sp. SD6-1 TaxID=3032581 RepID=UPI0024DFBB5B|nr:flagellar biosynthesis protein [Frigidibacter sp. SD6-1]
MARILELETFDLPDDPLQATLMGDAQVAEMKLLSYEQGYQAGWDDALGAQNDDITRLRTELGRNLTEMALSYRDARRHILASLEPLLDEMVAKVLPAIAHQALGPMILEELGPVVDRLAATPVTIRTAPANQSMVEELLAQKVDVPVQVVAEPTLGPGQAFLKTAAGEVQIDLDGVVGAIGAAVKAYFQTEHDEVQP